MSSCTRLIWMRHSSVVLRPNPWGDPFEREVAFWLPPGYQESSAHYPVVFYLAPFLGSGLSAGNWQPFGENIVQRLDRLYATGQIGPMLVVFPDAYTVLGGNQYVNSSAVGAYGDYLSLELVPFVDAHFRTLPQKSHRGVLGKSSGAYGALRLAMDYPTVWGAVAHHSGDAYFDVAYRHAWPETMTYLASLVAHQSETSLEAAVHLLIQSVRQASRPSSAATHALMNIAMAATYDPDPNAELGFQLPMEWHSGRWREERWAHWLAHDPLYRVSSFVRELQQLRCLYLDCGNQDTYHLHYGARQLSECLRELRVPHEYVEFVGTHSDINHRLDESFPLLYQSLKH